SRGAMKPASRCTMSLARTSALHGGIQFLCDHRAVTRLHRESSAAAQAWHFAAGALVFWIGSMAQPRRAPPEPVQLPRGLIDHVVPPFARFMRIEAAGGAVLLLATVAAIGLANSSWSTG